MSRLNSPFTISADILKCLLSGSTGLIGPRGLRNYRKRTEKLAAAEHTVAGRHSAAHLNPK